ncbi:MAG: hypothetical protein GY953_15710 [bacterium]|nr:hypothetical protein [bacterium]
MSDERIQRALEALPREKASADFTRRVLDNLPQQPRRRIPAWSYRLAAAATVVILLVLPISLQRWSMSIDTGSEAMLAEIEAVRSEKALIEKELRQLREQATAESPVVYIGGNEDVNLVLDIGALLNRSTEASPEASAH